MKLKHIPINRAPDEQTTLESLAGRMRRTLDRVRDRAYQLFDRRGREHGRDLEDWFQAEYECGLLPVAAVDETETEVRLRIQSSEFSADQLRVHVESQAISVEGAAVQEVESYGQAGVTERSLFGRYELPAVIDTDLVTATLENGVLQVVARKAEIPVEVVSGIDETLKKPPTAKTDKDKSATAG